MRHPLTELSLDLFIIPPEHRSPVKRPLSPGSTLLSPTKRRIFCSEGLYTLQKKSHHSPSKLASSDLVRAPPSPARKLDFAHASTGRAKHERDASPRPETPVSHSSGASRLQPSPTIASSSSSDASKTICDDLFESSCHHPLAGPMLIRREIPTFVDRQSIHWPGFDVHADTHIAIPTSDNIAPRSVDMDSSEVDDAKENVRPRKRAGKRVAPDDGKSVKPSKIGRMERRLQD